MFPENPGFANGDRRDDAVQAATIEAVDRNVGRIVNHLTPLGLAGDTLLIFTSDNGGTAQHTPQLRGGNGELYEGGIRVPLVVPGAAPPAGQRLDGVSLVPLFRDARPLDRPRLFWHFPCYVGRATPASAIREGRWKLIEFYEDGGRVELYDLVADPAERRDLSHALPERTSGLATALRTWQRETAAVTPNTANPAYDLRADRPRGGRQAGAKRDRGAR